ncbi:hypothetical protein M0R45_038229 [Rubus argutus]|uniref:Uncharacterized protein n=1 Tax=Rubus argutus TaxID=59490 RepID=A0AAW1W523_RUBAR
MRVQGFVDMVDHHSFVTRHTGLIVAQRCSPGSTEYGYMDVLKDYDKKEWTRDYSINLEMPPNLHPKFGALDFTCDQWEHG